VFGKPTFRLQTPCGLANKKPQQLAMTSQTTSCTLSDEVHVLAISKPYKENQQSLSMIMPHYCIMPLKNEALQHLWQTFRLSLTPII
jgi:serine protease inhibitor